MICDHCGSDHHAACASCGYCLDDGHPRGERYHDALCRQEADAERKLAAELGLAFDQGR